MIAVNQETFKGKNDRIDKSKKYSREVFVFSREAADDNYLGFSQMMESIKLYCCKRSTTGTSSHVPQLSIFRYVKVVIKLGIQLLKAFSSLPAVDPKVGWGGFGFVILFTFLIVENLFAGAVKQAPTKIKSGKCNPRLICIMSN